LAWTFSGVRLIDLSQLSQNKYYFRAFYNGVFKSQYFCKCDQHSLHVSIKVTLIALQKRCYSVFNNWQSLYVSCQLFSLFIYFSKALVLSPLSSSLVPCSCWMANHSL